MVETFTCERQFVVNSFIRLPKFCLVWSFRKINRSAGGSPIFFFLEEASSSTEPFNLIIKWSRAAKKKKKNNCFLWGDCLTPWWNIFALNLDSRLKSVAVSSLFTVVGHHDILWVWDMEPGPCRLLCAAFKLCLWGSTGIHKLGFVSWVGRNWLCGLQWQNGRRC